MPNFILVFLIIAFSLLVSSCSGLVAKNQSVEVTDIQIKGYTSTKKLKFLANPSSKSIKNLNNFKPNKRNKKSSYWLSPINKNAKLIKKYSKNQPRISYQAKVGSEVYAVRSGVVEFSGVIKNIGLTIVIKHLHGFTSIYLNNYRNLVKAKEKVEKGQLIAQIGKNPQNPKKGLLNFELRKKNKNINPQRYF